MRTYHYRYLVRLEDQQRRWLETLDTGIVSRQDGATGLCGAHQSRDGENHAQKNELKPWLKKSWCFPKEADGEFVYHMEDVLGVYCQPYDPAVPRICMDEMGKNLFKDKYPPERGLARTSGAERLQLRKRRPRHPVHCL
jgi:hypothetical protein